MKWLTSYQVYIDPSIKSFDKGFYNRCEQIVTHAGLKYKRELQALEETRFPIVYIFFDELPENHVCPQDIYIYLKKPNLDFLSKSYMEEGHAFEVEDIVDFEHIWDVIIDYMLAFVVNLESDFVSIRNDSFRNIFSQKKIARLKDANLSELFSQFENGLYELDHIDAVNEYVALFCHENQIRGVRLLSIMELMQTKSDKYVPIEFISGHYLYLVWDEEDLYVTQMYIILKNYFVLYENLNQSQAILDNWREFVSLVQIPIVFLDASGHALIYNKLFTSMGLSAKECQQLNNNDQLTINKNTFRVILNKNEQEGISYLFYPVSDILSSKELPSSEELGIVSSSISHELNNPLGGILAAIDVLALDSVSDEVNEKLQEMKNGVLRCKKLVETFLGFSRLKAIAGKDSTVELNFRDSVQQALDLIRFRLIENNITLNVDYESNHRFSAAINPHVLSMIFYLILGELVTSYSHINLVHRSNSLRLELVAREEMDRLVFVLPDQENLQRGFFESKLLTHLLDVVSLKIKQAQGSLEFYSC